MEKKLLYCSKCDDLVPFVVKTTEVTHNIKGEDIIINTDLPYCSICNTQLSDLKMEEKHFNQALDEYRRRKNILFPEEIKKIRELYKLSQRAFARALGFSEPTINRYELGALPDKTHNNLILLAKVPENMKILVEQNKANLSESEYRNVCKIIDEFIFIREKQSIINKGTIDQLLEKVDKLEKKLDKVTKNYPKSYGLDWALNKDLCGINKRLFIYQERPEEVRKISIPSWR